MMDDHKSTKENTRLLKEINQKFDFITRVSRLTAMVSWKNWSSKELFTRALKPTTTV